MKRLLLCNIVEICPYDIYWPCLGMFQISAKTALCQSYKCVIVVLPGTKTVLLKS